MVTIRKWLEGDRVSPEIILGFVFDKMHPGMTYSTKWPEDENLYGRLLSVEEASPFMDVNFSDGYGWQDVPNFNFWTEDRVYYVHEYDGSTTLMFVPRHPPLPVREFIAGPLEEAAPHLTEGLKRYVEHRIETGGFLRACLENDMMDACRRADDENRHRLFDIMAYIHEKLPALCHGSPQKVADWLKGRHLK